MPHRLRRPARRRATVLHACALAGVAGLMFIGDGIYLKAKALLAQHLIASAWEKSRTEGIAPAPWPWADTRPVALLSVPRLERKLYVLEGDRPRTLAFGPGHRSASPLPGKPGNSIISGHRDTHFKFLRELLTGDEVVIESRSGSLRRYRVVQTEVVHKGDLSVIGDSDDPRLTLITCYPFDALTTDGPLRWVVTATAANATN
ncbi:MAG TPA: class GN sortase [Burkholderiales bacterium]|nr:class GN sortase [Burkholderiales bacterium]